jgi:multiple sugar transport system substrate-binding protein
MRRTRLLALSLLAALAFSACSPVTPLPTETLDLPTVPATASTVPTLTPTDIPTLLPTATPTPSATPLPAIQVDPALLRGLEIQVWQAFAGPASELFTSQVAQFNAGNQWGIVISPTGYGDYTGLFEAVNAALDAGQAPDLAAALPEQALAWQARRALVDLTAYLDDLQWGLPVADRADFPAIFWQQDAVDGRQLGVPAQRSARLLYYNQTWARELGFNSPPATADEFRQQACAANASFRMDADPRNDGYGGWIVDTTWQTSYSWLLAFGGGVEQAGVYYFRSDPNLAALQFLKSLFDSHCAWLSIEPTPFDSFARRSGLFISADLAGLPAELESMARLKSADEWTVIPFPGSQGRLVVTYGPSYSIMSSTPEKQLAAWLFVRWLLQPESQSQWVEQTGLFPLRSSVLDMIGPYRQASPQWEAACGYLSLAQGVPQLASWRKIRYVLQDGMTVLFQTDLPVDKLASALEEMDAMAQEVSKK